MIRRDSSGAGSRTHEFALVGYLDMSTFANDSYIPLGAVTDDWDMIILELDPVEGPDYTWTPCFSPACPQREPEQDFTAAVSKMVSQGKLVQVTIDDTPDLSSNTTRDRFVSSVGQFLQTYGLTGVHLDLVSDVLGRETHEPDFRAPSLPVNTNFISAIKTLSSNFSPNFALTVTVASGFLQSAAQQGFFGINRYNDSIYLPLVDSLRDEITLLCTANYNTPAVANLDNTTFTAGSPDYIVSMADMLLGGFEVMIDSGLIVSFRPLRVDQVGFTLRTFRDSAFPEEFTNPTDARDAISCLTTGARCGTYKPKFGPYAGFGGIMLQELNDEEGNGGSFRKILRPFLDELVANSSASSTSATSTAITSSTSAGATAPNAAPASPTPSASSHTALFAGIIVAVLSLLIGAALTWYMLRRRARRRAERRAETEAVLPRPYNLTEPAQSLTAEPARSLTHPKLERHLIAPLSEGSTSTAEVNTAATEEMAAVQAEMGRVGLSPSALLSSLARLRAPIDTRSESHGSDAAPPTYV